MELPVSQLTSSGLTTFSGVSSPTSSFSGITSLASSLPGGSLLSLGTGLLDSLNITENIGNVLQYGLNSWGASTNPSEAKTFFQNTINPMIANLLTGLNESNIEENLKQASKVLEHGIALYKHKVARHFKANSSIEAGKLNIQMYTSLRDSTLKPVVADLQKQGVIQSAVYATASDAELQNMPAGGDDPNLHQDAPLRYPYWPLKQSFFDKVVQTVSGSQIDSNGNPQPSTASSGGLGGILGIGALIFFGRKLL